MKMSICPEIRIRKKIPITHVNVNTWNAKPTVWRWEKNIYKCDASGFMFQAGSC